MSMNHRKPVQIVHVLEQRVRLHAPALAGHPAVCRRVAEALAVLEANFDRVTVRPSTGSVIVEGEEGPIDAELFAARLLELIDDERDDDGRPLTALRPEMHPGPTRVARAVAHAFSEINADLRATLGHRADLGTILPVFFAAASISEIAFTRKLPVPTWFNLLWWSLRSFMTFNIGAIEAEAHEAREAETA